MKIPNKNILESSLDFVWTKKEGFSIVAVKDIVFDFNGIDVKIPKDFISDGASLPFFLKAFVSKFDIHWVAGALLHDYLYRTQILDRRVADAFFKMVVEETANRFTAFTFWVGVRLGGWWAWYNNKKQNEK